MKKSHLILIIIISLIAGVFLFNYIKYDKEITIEVKVLAVGTDYLLVSTNDNIDYIVNTKDLNYNIGDIIELELKRINKDKSPKEATAKNIKIIKENINENIEEITTPNNDIKTKETINKNIYSESDIINYFENLDLELTNYNNDSTIGEKLKYNFINCIDFIFYDKEIGGITFKELTNTTKLKILEITMSIDSKIESKFPEYKESISSTYQDIKTRIIEVYLETTTSICNNEKDLCTTAKNGFHNLKDNLGITWDTIKKLAGNGITKLKDWYEIWKEN